MNLLFSLASQRHSVMSAYPTCGNKYSQSTVHVFCFLYFFSSALEGITTLARCQVWLKLNLDVQRDGTISLGPCVRLGRLMSCYGDQF